MNCEKCQELLSDFVDGALMEEERRTLAAHLEDCLSCSEVREELSAIVNFCHTTREELIAPPNERALWLRIRNVIEGEQQTAAASARAASAEKRAPSFWSRIMGQSFELSLPQVSAAIAAIILAVALATAYGVRQLQTSTESSAAGARTNIPAGGGPALAISNAPTAELGDDRTWPQEQAIAYWNQRVEYTKSRWSPQMRESFERNLSVIDQTVKDSLKELNQHPHDAVTEEMLNAALNDKVKLLKEFAEP